MKSYHLGIDVGGSHISCGLIDPSNGKIVNDEIISVGLNSKGTTDEIIQSFEQAIHSIQSQNPTYLISEIGVAIPGPFDYSRGICKITGVQKFDALFGLNIKQVISNLANHPDDHITLLNDASAFALGEYYAGASCKSKRSLTITLGTGFGSTFLIDGVIQTTTGRGIPANGYLYHIPFGESIADDYFSSRWLMKQWKKLTQKEAGSVREIAELASQNTPEAISVFNEFTENLTTFLIPWIEQFRPDVLVIGGNIARASYLFLEQLRKNVLTRSSHHPEIKICELWDNAPIIGAAMDAGIQQTAANHPYRKTEQFLAPEKSTPTAKGHYDIYPAFPLKTGKIREGIQELSQWILQHRTVIIDGYVGVFWDHLVENLNRELLKSGKKIRWFHSDAAMRPADEIEKMIEPYMGESDSIFGKMTDKQLADWFIKDQLKQITPDPEADINILTGCGASLAEWTGALIYIDLPKNELQFRMRAGTANNLGAGAYSDNRDTYKRFYFVEWPILNTHKRNLLPDIDLLIDEQRPDNYLFMQGDDLRNTLSGMSRNFFRVRPWFEPGAWGGTWMKQHIENLNKDVDNLAWSFELMVLENGLMLESDDHRLEISFDFLMYNNYKEVLGDCADRFKYDFPIRFDFLDTFDGGNLSVQCHPRPEYIQKEFGMPFTQDETYYIMRCKGEPVVYLGFQEGINPDEFHQTLVYSQDHAEKIDIEKFVQKFPAKKHDLFLIPNGTIHASGSNNLVLEISSAPYIFTFKMYDWVRLDLDGRPRPINIDHGMKNVYFERQGKRVTEELICKPVVLEENSGYKLEHLPTHPEHFYDVYRYTFDHEITIETNNKCHVWMLVEGQSVILETADGMKQRFNYAETFVIPAAAKSYTLCNESNEKACMVMSFVK